VKLVSESEIKKCPKCGGEMERGRRLVSYVGVTFAKKGDWFGDSIIPFYCKNCGYIELYKKMK
jgi:predicted nucleic-acid-binding Zn-ribbon protein